MGRDASRTASTPATTPRIAESRATRRPGSGREAGDRLRPPASPLHPFIVPRGMGRLMHLARTSLILLSLATAAMPFAGAHQISYPTTPISPHLVPAPTFWYGTYAAGHVTPGVGGTADFAIFDAIGQFVGAQVCQDLNGDFICGGPGELSVSFCSTVTVVDVPNGGLWVPSDAIYLYPDPTVPLCGIGGFWFVGVINHS